MKLKTAFLLTAFAITLFWFPNSTEAATGSFKVTTRVVDFVTTEWTLECPDGKTIDLMTANISESGLQELMGCLNDLESENGLHIRSRTVVRNGVVESDVIHSTTRLTEEQASKLCQIVSDNPAPPRPKTHRPRMFCVHDDKKVAHYSVTLPDGRILDLTKLEARLLTDVLALLEQFEQQNGVHVINTSRTSGGRVDRDRIITLTWLTPEQLLQLDQLLATHGQFIVPGIAVYPTDATLRLHAGRRAHRLSLTGEMTIARGPQLPPTPDNQALLIPTEILQLDLVTPNNPRFLHLGLDPNQTSQGMIIAPAIDAPAESLFDVHIQLNRPNTPAAFPIEPLQLQASLDSPYDWVRQPFTVYNQLGVGVFEMQGNPMRAKLRLLQSGPPRVVLAPLN